MTQHEYVTHIKKSVLGDLHPCHGVQRNNEVRIKFFHLACAKFLKPWSIAAGARTRDFTIREASNLSDVSF